MVIAVVGIVMNADGGSAAPEWGKGTTVGKDGLPSRKNWENNR